MKDFLMYFQISSLSFFLVVFIGRTIILQIKGVKVFVIAQGKSISVRLLEIAFIVFLLFWIMEIYIISLSCHSLIPDNDIVFQNNYLHIAGAIVQIIGLIIFVWAIVSFQKSWRIGIDEKNPGKLITDGIFKYTRNPIFVFINLYFIGIAMVLPNYFFIVMAFSAIYGIHKHILNEEKHLKKLYKQDYIEYCSKTRRYF